MAEEESFDTFPIISAERLPTAAAESDDSFDEFPMTEPSAEEKVGAFGRQATGAAVQGAAILTGMGAGAAIGTLGGPAAPVTVPLGAAVGAGAGYLFGEGAKDILGVPKIESLPEEVRPYAVAGETVGASLPFAGAPLVAARAGSRLPPSMVGNFINRIVDMAARSPGAFALSEAGGISGAAVAGGTAEAYFPGQPGARVAAEIAGGFFNPTRLVVGVSKGSLDITKKAIQSMSQSGRETRAAKFLIESIEAAGEDPAVLARLLRETGTEGVTSAQKTGSPALIAIESKLAQESAKFGSDAKKAAEDSLSAIKEMVIALRGTGDPEALSAAADLRLRYFRTLLAGRIQTAEREAVEAAGRITSDTPQARTELARRAHGSVEKAMQDARTVESELWEQVPKDVRASATSVLESYDNLRAGMLPEETFPNIVEGFVGRMRDGQAATTSGELILFRSRALALARESDVQGKVNDARIYGRLAESALDDLDKMATQPAFGAYGRTADGYNDARAFSREFNEIFTRTFAGQSMQTGARGADRIPPELTLRRAFAAGKEAGELRLRELEEATRFLPSKGLGGPEAVENLDIMLDAQRRILRLAASDAVDPTTGRASAVRLSKFMNDNATLLDRFPEIRTDLQTAIKSEQGLQSVQDMAKGASKVIESQAAFAKVAKVENPVDAIRSAVSEGNKNPIRDVTAMVKLAKRGGPEAVEGLKASVWDHALREATDTQGILSLGRLKAALDQPIRPGQPSLFKIMKDEGIVGQADITRAGKLFSEAAKIERALTGDTDIESLGEIPGALFDLALRVTGARVGGTMAQGTSGATLIAAARGSEFMRNVFLRVPQTRIRDVLVQAGRDPQFMAMLLEKPKTQTEGIKLARQVHAYLLQTGLTGLEDGGDD